MKTTKTTTTRTRGTKTKSDHSPNVKISSLVANMFLPGPSDIFQLCIDEEYFITSGIAEYLKKKIKKVGRSEIKKKGKKNFGWPGKKWKKYLKKNFGLVSWSVSWSVSRAVGWSVG